MEKGELGIAERPAIAFVFEGLIAELSHQRREQVALKAHKWDIALDQWVFDFKVRLYIQTLIDRFEVPIEVLTWRPIGFAEALYERLWYYDVNVRSVKSTTYQIASQDIATDPYFRMVYDADPAHRFGYGFKCREFNLGQY
jgi:hypothetical protein